MLLLCHHEDVADQRYDISYMPAREYEFYLRVFTREDMKLSRESLLGISLVFIL